MTNENDTLVALKTHARRFGTEGVMETAAEIGLGFTSLVGLQKTVDELDGAAKKKFGKTIKHRTSAEERVKKLLGLTEEEDE